MTNSNIKIEDFIKVVLGDETDFDDMVRRSISELNMAYYDLNERLYDADGEEVDLGDVRMSISCAMDVLETVYSNTIDLAIMLLNEIPEDERKDIEQKLLIEKLSGD